MPVDIASGSVDLPITDVTVKGRISLTWDRRYSSSFLNRPPTLLGKGWHTRYLATLTQQAEAFEFVTPKGSRELLRDTEGIVQRGGRAINFGAYLEVFKDQERYVVQHWDVDTEVVLRYCFQPGMPGQPWPLTSIEDPTGQALDLTWDDSGRLAAIQQRLERRTLVLNCSRAGFVEAVHLQTPGNPPQTFVRYEYDDRGRLISAHDAAGNTDHYEYDENNRLIREVSKDGGVFIYRYDTKGRCVKTSGLDRYDEKRLRFLDASRVTEVTDSYGRTFRYQYLPTGQILRKIGPSGNESRNEYDDYGRVTALTNANGDATLYQYDSQGNRCAIIDPLGNRYSFLYNDQHLAVQFSDPNGGVWQREYDDHNRLRKIVDPAGARWALQYDAEGNVAEITSPLGTRRRQHFANGTLQQTIDGLGAVSTYQHDAMGRLTRCVGPMGNVVSLDYDVRGNPLKIVLPDRSAVTMTYDPTGHVTSIVDGTGQVTRYRFGPCGRLLARERDGNVTKYAWGTEPDWLNQIINENGEVYVFCRDETGRVIREKSFDGREQRYQYDAAGRLKTATDANGETIIIDRDRLGRIVKQRRSDGGFKAFQYDAAGHLVVAQNENIVIRLERDPLGRVVNEIQGDDWVATKYDAVGRPVHLETSRGVLTDFEFDANGWLAAATLPNSQAIEFRRNSLGHEIARTLPGQLVMEQSRDEVGRLLEQRIGNIRPKVASESALASALTDDTALVKRRYEYNAHGSLKELDDRNWGISKYVYGPGERLLQVITDLGLAESYEYDGPGNIVRVGLKLPQNERVDEECVYETGNRLIRKGSTRFHYDPQGRLTRKTVESDGIAPQTWVYTWDSLDQLCSVQRPDGVVWRYKYDAFGRRIEKRSHTTTIRFVWNRDVVMHECDTTSDKAADISWVFIPGTTVPLATLQDCQLFSVITDHLGTPKEILDSEGRLRWQFNHSAFGTALRLNNLGEVHCNIRFQGQYYDSETGFHYNRFRYYDPSCGRYISQDPIRLLGGHNFYSYTASPASRTDAYGLDPKTLGPEDQINRSMKPDSDGNWVPSPPGGAPNGTQLGARTGMSNPKFPDFPDVKSPSDILGPAPGPDGKFNGLSGSLTPFADDPKRGTTNGSVLAGDLPEGLAAVNDHDDHVAIVPTREMTFEEYQEKLNSIPWKKDKDDEEETGCGGGAPP